MQTMVPLNIAQAKVMRRQSLALQKNQHEEVHVVVAAVLREMEMVAEGKANPKAKEGVEGVLIRRNADIL